MSSKCSSLEYFSPVKTEEDAVAVAVTAMKREPRKRLRFSDSGDVDVGAVGDGFLSESRILAEKPFRAPVSIVIVAAVFLDIENFRLYLCFFRF